MGMTYSAYRLPAGERLLAEHHGVWIGDEEPLFVLEPDRLTVEYRYGSVDAEVHNRAQVRRYRIGDSVERVDPVALQPQDFVEEWLTQPWSEMAERSAPETKAVHGQLHADFVMGEYLDVAPCLMRPGRWRIGLEITHVGGKQLDDPRQVFFVVQDLGGYRYRMEHAGDEPEGCPGGGQASEKHPWLTAEELKALK
jgi:hypothetical protein